MINENGSFYKRLIDVNVTIRVETNVTAEGVSSINESVSATPNTWEATEEVLAAHRRWEQKVETYVSENSKGVDTRLLPAVQSGLRIAARLDKSIGPSPMDQLNAKAEAVVKPDANTTGNVTVKSVPLIAPSE